MKKTIHPFFIAIVIMIAILVFSIALPTQKVGDVRNEVIYKDPVALVIPTNPTESTIATKPTEVTKPTEIIEPTEPTELIKETVPEEIEPEPEEWEEPEETPEYIEPSYSCVNWYSDYRVYPTGEYTYTAGGYEFDYDFLAKLLYCEGGGMNWEGQVYTCSAILNFCDVNGRSLWDAGHDINCFEPAPYVDYASPTSTQYEVIDHVLSGGRIAEICYFRSGGRYHDFGTPVCEVDGHYFSK